MDDLGLGWRYLGLGGCCGGKLLVWGLVEVVFVIYI